MKPTGSPWLAAGAAAACALLALSYLPVGRGLRYAALGFSSDARLAWLLPLAIAGAFVNERLVRGWLYRKLRDRLAPGLAAPCVALLGAVVPATARIAVFGRKGAAPAFVAGHAFLVGSLLGLGLAWLALATGSTVPGGAALAAVWAAKLGIRVESVGPAVPLLELCASGLAAAGVAAVLWSALAPHREKVMGTA